MSFCGPGVRSLILIPVHSNAVLGSGLCFRFPFIQKQRPDPVRCDPVRCLFVVHCSFKSKDLTLFVRDPVRFGTTLG